MLYVIAPNVTVALALAAEVGEPRKTTVPITPVTCWRATRGRKLKADDTILFTRDRPHSERVASAIDLMSTNLSPEEQVRCRVFEWELRS